MLAKEKKRTEEKKEEGKNSKLKLISVWHIEKESRTIYIDNSQQKKDSITVISNNKPATNTIKSSIRATCATIAKDLKLKNYISLTENFVNVGPFKLSMEKVENCNNKINIIIHDEEDSFYFFSGIPDERTVLGENFSILFPANIHPESIFPSKTELISFLKFSKAKKIILSGEHSTLWQKILESSIKCEIIEESVQLRFF